MKKPPDLIGLLPSKSSSMMWTNSSCPDNCSGHGECVNRVCVCEIQFEGVKCSGTNVRYFVSFASVFLLVSLVCLIQLVMCILAERQRMKAPSLRTACRITTQKLLYFVVFLASLMRAAYFTYPVSFAEGWSSSLMSAYYPLLLSGSSLIVCFWAELFHLRDIRWDKPQFLSKSFLAFVTFNVITYSLLIAECATVKYLDTNPQLKSFYTHVFNGCYAVLLLIVLVFFLLYGVEVFFKVRGGFMIDEGIRNHVSNNIVSGEAHELFGTSFQSTRHLPNSIDTSQLHQSRLGLLSQALMLTFVVALLCSETFGGFWKNKVPLYSRNWHNLAFRVVEIGVALWFPCVLWNCMSPEQLWILNPKRILKKLDLDKSGSIALTTRMAEEETELPSEDEAEGCLQRREECWICYGTNQEAGPLIQPCHCKGDIKIVHHSCLKKWLIEKSESRESLCCPVCQAEYTVCWTKLDWQTGFTPKHCWQTALIVCCMCLSAVCALLVIQLFINPKVKILATGSVILVEYICIKFLSQNTEEAYYRAKYSGLSISSTSETGNISTISNRLGHII